MKLTLNRPILYLPVAAVVVALFVIARPVLNPPAIPAQQSSNPVTTTGQPPVVPVVDLNLDRLHAASRELGPSQRDPFRFRPKPAPPAPRVQAPPPQVFAPPAPVGPPPVPRIPLQYLGTFTVNGQRLARFRDERGYTFNGKEGETLEGRYRVLRITQDSVDLAHIDGRGQQTLRAGQ